MPEQLSLLPEAERPLVALSLRQPWAWAVLNGKGIENRVWNTRFRGRFLIHAAKGMTRGEYQDAAHFCLDNGMRVPEFAALDRGGIVGEARLVDVIHPKGSAVDLQRAGKLTDGWHMAWQFGFVLAEVKPLPFIPCVGSLGFFRVSAEENRARALGAFECANSFREYVEAWERCDFLLMKVIVAHFERELEGRNRGW